MAKDERVSVSVLSQQELTDDIKVVCPEDERLWLTFTRDMTRRQWKQFEDALQPPNYDGVVDDAKAIVGECNIPDDTSDAKATEMLNAHIDTLGEEIDRQRELRADEAAERLYDLLRQVVIGGQFVCQNNIYDGIEAIIEAAKNDDLTFIAEGFLVSAHSAAAVKLRELGNARRPN